MQKQKVLFVCIHNSARSQMAEAFLRKHGGHLFEAESAGLEPGTMNQQVTAVMKETGIDLSGKQPQGVFDLLKRGNSYDFVITVCDKKAAEECPVFPGTGNRIGWSFPDPSRISGTADEVRAETRQIRDEIEITIKQFIKENH